MKSPGRNRELDVILDLQIYCDVAVNIDAGKHLQHFFTGLVLLSRHVSVAFYAVTYPTLIGGAVKF